MKKLIWYLSFSVLFFLWNLSLAGQWINPKDLIGDPNIARLQQGRKEVTPEQREDIKKYGFTGLELMTYVDANRDPGQDWDIIERVTTMNASGIIQVGEEIYRRRIRYKNYKERLILERTKPGDEESQRIGFYLYPSKDEGNIWMSTTYVKSKDVYKERTSWNKTASLRKVRRGHAPNRQDKTWGTDMTSDDRGHKKPWEENWRILGKDTLRGKDCLVVEGKMWFVPNYYLSKRVVWVEGNNFVDIHEEQFNKKGRLFKIMDKDWVQVKPWNYWTPKSWNVVDLSTKSRTLEEYHEWIFDQGLTEKHFSTKAMNSDNPWRQPKNLPPYVEKASDFPSDPQVRWEFWEKLGIKPEEYK